jgi:hypothetical protein
MRADKRNSKKGTVWTTEMLEVIATRYASATTEEIVGWCKGWKVTRDMIRAKAKYLGVQRNPEAARQSYSEGNRGKGNTTVFEGIRPDLDLQYVNACIAQGGFPVVVWINGQPRTVYRSEWAR